MSHSNVSAFQEKRRQYVWLIGIVLLGIALRAGLAIMPRVIRWDEPDYLWLGRNLLSGRGYTVSGVPELHYTPLYPILAGGVYLLTGDAELGSAVWFALLGALAAVPAFFLARKLYGLRVALLSASLVAVFPTTSSSVLFWGTMTEPLFVLLLYCGVWALVAALERDTAWPWALSGALFALSYLARPEGLVWSLAGAVLLVGARMVRHRFWRWHTLLCVFLYVAAFALLAAPYARYLWRETGSVMLTGKLSITHDIGQAILERNPVLYDKVTASLDEQGEILWWSRDRFEQSMVDIVRDDPAGFLERVWRNLAALRGQLFSSLVFPMFLVAPVVLGWFRQPWTRKRLRGEAALWAGILPVLSFLPFHIEARFLAPVFPALLIWLAHGLDQAASWVVDTVGHWQRGRAVVVDARWLRGQGRALAVLCAALALLIGFTHVRVIASGMADMPFAHRQAGLWLRQNTDAGASVMSRDLAISLYAERGFVASPRADYGDWLAYARRKGASYLVVDERELRVLRPHLAFLLDTTKPPPDLEPTFEARDGRGVTIVYRIKD